MIIKGEKDICRLTSILREELMRGTIRLDWELVFENDGTSTQELGEHPQGFEDDCCE